MAVAVAVAVVISVAIALAVAMAVALPAATTIFVLFRISGGNLLLFFEVWRLEVSIFKISLVFLQSRTPQDLIVLARFSLSAQVPGCHSYGD